MNQDERMVVEQILSLMLDGESVHLNPETLLVDDIHIARQLLHQSSIIIAEFAGQMPMGSGMGISVLADALHRASCEKEATKDQPEEPTSWSNQSPFLS